MYFIYFCSFTTSTLIVFHFIFQFFIPSQMPFSFLYLTLCILSLSTFSKVSASNKYTVSIVQHLCVLFVLSTEEGYAEQRSSSLNLTPEKS